MNSRQRRKLEAEKHNEIREAQKALEQDRIDNPEKYKATRAQRRAKRKAMSISPNGFDNRLSK